MNIREIKFRAWDREMQEWYLWETIEAEFLGLILQGKYPEFILMQYTGLKDKNGKEMYEGDILEWSVTETHGGVVRQLDVVEWENGAFITRSPKYQDGESFYDDGNREQITTESIVIGNIYENPELLN